MQSFVPFKEKIPKLSQNLPLTCISLEEWILIRLRGEDNIQYLHNQLTCDVKSLKKDQYTFAANCNIKGKVISSMYVFYLTEKEIGLIIRSSMYKKQISEMKKYAIFSKVIFTLDHNVILIGIAGKNTKEYLNTIFKILPNQIKKIIHYKNIILLHFNQPTERFLLIIYKESILNKLLNLKQCFIETNNSRQWVALDIEANYPLIDIETTEIFIPQAINMDILQGISFNKGCYIGQEIIARIQHHKSNKYTLYKLDHNMLNWNIHNQLPKAGTPIEHQINSINWKKIGIVLQSCKTEETKVLIQGVLKKSALIKNKKFKINTINEN